MCRWNIHNSFCFASYQLIYFHLRHLNQIHYNFAVSIYLWEHLVLSCTHTNCAKGCMEHGAFIEEQYIKQIVCLFLYKRARHFNGGIINLFSLQKLAFSSYQKRKFVLLQLQSTRYSRFSRICEKFSFKFAFAKTYVFLLIAFKR